VSRRRELGDTSARSLLMTILGEFVLGRPTPAWTATLVSTLALFEVEEKSARQALARSASEGWIRSQRFGRRVRWELTPPGRRLLTEGAERIYSFGRPAPPWDGRWLVVLVSVPESKRELRHRLRTQLSWAGFGSPANGVWISPDVSRQAEAHAILEDLALPAGPMSFIARYGSIGEQQAMVADAWDLAGVSARYQQFIDEFAQARPASHEDALRGQIRLVHEWRRFPFLDPQLPAELLPARWTGTRAAALFADKHVAWRPAAQARWDELAAIDDGS
jgi:phenylacetic acid degradation operon negative regulatory protein